MKHYRILLVLLTTMLCLLALSGSVGATLPETIRFKAANPTFGPPCEEPPNLGFEPLDSYSENLDLMSLEEEQIGTGFFCHFVKSNQVNENVGTQVNFTSGNFSLSDGTVEFIGETRYRSLPNSSIRVKLRGNITGGSETFDGVEGKVEAGGKVTFNDEGNLIPDVTFVLHLK